MKTINGQIVTEKFPLSELEKMLESSDMQKFAVACEALRLANTRQAYEVLKKHISDPDRYKRRCILSVIYDYSCSSELIPELLGAMQSDEMFLVTTALDIIIQGKVHAVDEQIFACIEKNQGKLDSYYYRALSGVENSEENMERILKLYSTCKEKSVRSAIAECLYVFRNEKNYVQLFELFEGDAVPHIRILACRIAKDYHRADLLQKFIEDEDGHIRKIACEGDDDVKGKREFIHGRWR